MNYQEYKQLFEEVLSSENRLAPYDDEMYFSYTKLNRARIKRWDKHLGLDDKLVQKLKSINAPQHWIIITEPWCGDAAHIIPFLVEMSGQNELISYDLILRDTEPYIINSYLTNGTKSIPKLVVRDAFGVDLFIWGPRPQGAQDLVDRMKITNADFEEVKLALQHWYNEDQGRSLCKELSDLF